MPQSIPLIAPNETLTSCRRAQGAQWGAPSSHSLPCALGGPQDPRSHPCLSCATLGHSFLRSIRMAVAHNLRCQ